MLADLIYIKSSTTQYLDNQNQLKGHLDLDIMQITTHNGLI